MSAATPEAVLREMGACLNWVRRAHGKSWRQMFAIAVKTGRRGDTCLGWMVLRLMPRDDDSLLDFCCGTCNRGFFDAMAALPFDAWMDALKAYIFARSAP